MKMQDDWMQNPRLAGMDPSKLAMLQMMADQGSNKSAQEMMPFLMSAFARGQNSGLHFSDEEVRTLLEVLTAGKSPAETAKLNRLISLMRMIRR